MATIQNIEQGRKARKSFFDFSHDYNSTLNFGFCQPTLIDEVMPGSNVSLRVGQFLRLAPMPTPTFARVKVHNDVSFIPFKEIFPAHEAMMSRTSVNPRGVSYVPAEVDEFSRNQIYVSLLRLSLYYANLGKLEMCPFRFGICTGFHKGTQPAAATEHWSDFGNIFQSTDKSKFYTALRFFNENFNALDFSDNFTFDFVNAQSIINPFLYNVASGEYLPASSPVQNWLLRLFLPDSPDIPYYSKLGTTGMFPTWVSPTLSEQALNSWSGDEVTKTLFTDCTGLDEWHDFVTLDNADYIVPMDDMLNYEGTVCDADGNIVSGDFVSPVENCFFCIKLTEFGRRLMRIFTTCRQQVLSPILESGHEDETFSILPLLAYYKAWYDIYNPGRVTNWHDTNCYYLIHHYYDFYMKSYGLFIKSSTDADAGEVNVDGWRRAWFGFLEDLRECVYVLPIDNISVAYNDVYENTRQNYIPIQYTTGSQNELQVYDSYPAGHIRNINDADSVTVKALLRLFSMTSKESVDGQRVREMLKRFNINVDFESNILHRSSYYAKIGDVFSTAETADGFLGEYAGRGEASGEFKVKMTDTHEYGFIVVLTSIAPHAGYVQGDYKHPVKFNDFYQPEFDSLGMEAMSNRDVVARQVDLTPQQKVVFGFRPRYFGLKVRNNIANGYFAERSNQSSILPYSLDRLFTVKDYYSDGSNRYKVREVKPYVPYAGEDIRKVGVDESVGQYDRIFYDTTGLTDNFILDQINDYKVWSPMMPVSESFGTFDKDVDDTTNEVTHA